MNTIRSKKNSVTTWLALTILITVFCLTFPGRAEADIEVDAVSSGTGNSSITISHTTGSGSNRLMLVGIYADVGDPAGITSVTYNDDPLELVGLSQLNWLKLWIYKLVAPDTSTHNMVVNFSESTASRAAAGVMTFTGVDQTTPLGTFASATGSSGTASVNVSSASGELVFDTVGDRDYQATVGADQTQRWNIEASQRFCAGSTEPGAATVTMSWTFTSTPWTIGAVPIKPWLQEGQNAAPVFRTVSLYTNDAASFTHVIDKPAGTVEGDLMIAILSSDSGAGQTLGAPDGTWTPLHHDYFGAANGGHTSATWWKIAGDSEPGTYTFTSSVSGEAVCAILRYDGHDPVTPINASDVANCNGATQYPAPPQVTTTVINTTVLKLFGADHDDIPYTKPSVDYSERFSHTSDATGGAGADIAQASKGLTDTEAFSMGASEEWVAFTIAIAPPAALLADHAAVQETDKFGAESSVTGAELFAFALTNNRDISVTVSQVQFQLLANEIVEGDFTESELKIYVDTNGDGDIDGESTTVGGQGDVNAGVTTITFSTPFVIAAGATVNYILKGDVSNLVEDDTLTIDLGPSNFSLTSGGVGGSAATSVTHTQCGDGMFSYRRSITINSDKVGGESGNLPGFPVLISLTAAAFGDGLKNTSETGGHIESDQGYDIIFRKSDGTTGLYHEIESYDGTSGTLVAWVRIDSLSKGSDTTIYMYYGNKCITSPSEYQDGTAVWDTNYKGVWHLDSIASATDSTVNANHGSMVGSLTATSTSQIDGGLEFMNPWGTSSSGVVTYDSTNGGDYAYAITIDPSNNIYVAGSYWGPTSNSDWMVRKYTSGGTLDTTWGTSSSGAVTYDSGISQGDTPRAITIDGSNNIYVAGTYSNPIDWMVRKYDSDGTLVTSWGTNGAVTWDSGGNDFAGAITIDTLGNIYVAGYYFEGSWTAWMVRKYNSSGTLDTNFGTDGAVIWDSGNGNDHAYAITIDTLDNIYVAGYSQGDDNDWMVRKYNSSGTLVTSWGTNGAVTWDSGGSDTPRAITIDGSNNIYVAGDYYNVSNTDWMVRKYDSGGILDTTWGTSSSGAVTWDSGGSDFAYAITIDGSNNIYVAGSDNGTAYDWMVRKYDSGGTLDTSWGSSGAVTYDSSGTDHAHAITIDPSNNIYVAGYYHSGTSYDWMVRKYTEEGSLAEGPYVDVGNVITGVETVSFWIKPVSTTEKIIDLNGTAYIYVSGGTVQYNGFTDPTIYVDGVVISTIDTQWHHVAITTATGIDASAADIGRVSSSYLAGLLDEVRISDSDTVHDADWIKTCFNNQSDTTIGLGYFIKSLGNEDQSPATAVDLVSFTATGQGDFVLVEWETAQEIRNLGFNLYRSTEVDGSYTKLNSRLIPGLMSSATGRKYTHSDTDVIRGVLYYYLLEDVDLSGTRTMHGPICVDWDGDGIPDDYDEETVDDDSDSDSDDSDHEIRIPELRLYEVDFGPEDWTPSSSYASWVKLASFRARQGDEGVSLEWETNFEVDNFGFHLYREVDGKFYRITADLVPGSVFKVGSGRDLPAGQSYMYWDGLSEGTGHELYWLDCVEINGGRASFGPIKPEIYGQPVSKRLKVRFRSIARDQVSRARVLGKVRELREELSTKPIQTQSSKATFRKIDPEKPSEPRLPPSEEQWVLSAQPGVKIYIREDGWYRVGEPELVTAGLRPGVDPRYLQLYADGEEKSMMVTGSDDGRFDPEDAVEFYGTGLDTPFTDAHVYWLVVGSRPGRRLDTPFIDIRLDLGQRMRVPRGLRGRGAPLSFPYSVELKERTFYFAALTNGERENFFGSVISTDPVDQLLTVAHPDPSSPEDATLEVVLQGGTDSTHQIKIMFNYVEVGEVVFSGQEREAVEIQVPYDLLSEGDNIVTLTAQGGAMDVSLVDYIRLTYWRTYTADEDVLQFKVSGGEWLSIGGFSSSEIQVVDITDPMRMINIRGNVRTQDSDYAITVKVPSAGERTLLAFTEDKMKRPAGIEANLATSWHEINQGAEVIIIGHSDLLGSVRPLKELREQQGWSVVLVDVEDLYDEFNFGAKSPWALREFLARAYEYWVTQPRFVLLVGDASYDPRNYLGYGDFDLVPTKFVDTEFLKTASDDWFVDFNDDGLPEMAVGRLPVESVEEAAAVVSKIISYEAVAGLMNEVLLVADVNDTFDFEAASGEVRSLLPGEMTVREIFRGQSPTARSDLLTGLNQGQLLVNYIGHGSTKIWNGNLLTSLDAWNLTNSSYLPFFVSMTCLNGFFQDPYSESMAETFLKAERGGAVVVWTSSGLTFPGEQAVMNLELIRLLFNGEGLTIGEAIMGAKQAATDRDVRRTWILFGDPTLRLR